MTTKKRASRVIRPLKPSAPSPPTKPKANVEEWRTTLILPHVQNGHEKDQAWIPWPDLVTRVNAVIKEKAKSDDVFLVIEQSMEWDEGYGDDPCPDGRPNISSLGVAYTISVDNDNYAKEMSAYREAMKRHKIHYANYKKELAQYNEDLAKWNDYINKRDKKKLLKIKEAVEERLGKIEEAERKKTNEKRK